MGYVFFEWNADYQLKETERKTTLLTHVKYSIIHIYKGNLVTA